MKILNTIFRSAQFAILALGIGFVILTSFFMFTSESSATAIDDLFNETLDSSGQSVGTRDETETLIEEQASERNGKRFLNQPDDFWASLTAYSIVGFGIAIVAWLWGKWKNQKAEALMRFVKNLLSSKKPILILSVTIALFVGTVLYLRNYRLEYCQAKFPASRSRFNCINEPLYKFIF